jgi:hypothetical protein
VIPLDWELSFSLLTADSSSTRWLTDQEKLVAVARLQRDTGVTDEETMTLKQSVKSGVKDYKLWLMGLIYALMTTAGGYSAFVPTVVNTFGYSRVKTLLLTAPPYLLPAISELIVSFSSDRKPERCFHYSMPMVVGIVGFIIAATAKVTGPKYFSIFCMTFGMSSSFTVLLAWVGSTFARPRTKRAFAFGTVNALGNGEYQYRGETHMRPGTLLTVPSGPDLEPLPLPQG